MLLITSIANAISGFCSALSKYFEKRTEDTKHLSEKEIIKTKQRLEKAVNIGEELIGNTEDFFNWFVHSYDRTKEQSKQFRKFVKKHVTLKTKFNKED